MTTETSWTMIDGAARGDGAARSLFASRFESVIVSYLRTRWKGTPMLAQVDDAVQEVFVDCFRSGGALDKADASRGSFRAFLSGVVRNVALRFESGRGRGGTVPLPSSMIEADDKTPSAAFDASWAQAIMAETAQRMAQRGRERGGRIARRVELLRLRFHERKPIREIADEWDVPARELHKDYELARDEFRRTLREVVENHYCCPPEEIAGECQSLIDLLNR